MTPHYRVTFTRGPGARFEIEVPAPDPDTGCALGRARLLLALEGNPAWLAEWVMTRVECVLVPATLADLL